jgi:hypothetical protein
MDFEGMLTDAFAYTREGVWENTNRWLKLIIAIILLGLPFNGYVMRIYRGAHPAPDVDQWGTLFVDGLKLLLVGIIYALPVIIVWVIFVASMILSGVTESDEMAVATTGVGLLLMMVMYLFEIAIAIIMPVASIRFARTNSFGEAFNFSGIFGTIGRIGWLNYIVAIILVGLVVGIPMLVLIFGCIIVAVIVGGASMVILKEAGLLVFLAVLVLMILLILIAAPLFGIFQARCLTRVYDSAAPPVEPAP